MKYQEKINEVKEVLLGLSYIEITQIFSTIESDLRNSAILSKPFKRLEKTKVNGEWIIVDTLSEK